MENEYQTIFPVLPLRDVVVFPNLIMPLFVGRAKSVKALEAAEKAGGRILLVAQKAAEKDDPGEADLFTVGCVASVLQTLRLPDNTVKVLVEGGERAIVEKWNFADGESPLTAQIQRPPAVDVGEAEALALARAIKENLKSYGKAARRPPDWDQIMAIEGLAQLTDAVAAHFPLENAERQKLLEDFSAQSRAEKLLALIARETESQKIERKIKGRVKDQIEKSHREYYLNEQAKAIARELGEDSAADIDALKKRVKNAGMSEQARKKCEQEMRKLGMMSSMSAEATVARTYVETLLDLPWQKRGETKNDIPAARKILDEDHYALEKVKERILEYLAIQKRVKNGKAPILCLVGPPGVGKTSLGRSIARATGRRFARISVGGVRDEAEVRGHRRTYVGSMPGKIITTMTRAGVKNPLVLLDEIDKMGYDFRGDPAAALLEVLDPEQNRAFVDHYVEVDYDLSEVMFVTTANTLRIPPPLLDRLEIIRLSGYTEDEKINIAENYLRPRQFVENGVREGELKIQRPALRDMVRHYTREAGVRELERLVSKVCRKAVLEFETRGDEAARAKARAKRKAESADEAAAPAEVEKTDQAHRGHGESARQVFGRAPLSFRRRRRRGESRASHGLGVDRGWGRVAVDRGRALPRQRRGFAHRQIGGGHARIGRGGVFGRAHARRALRHRARFYERERFSHSLAGRGDSQRRPVGGRGHRGRGVVGGDSDSGARRHGDDRRNHFARRDFAGRRAERKTARGRARRHQARHSADGKQKRHGGNRRHRQGAI